MSMHLRNWWLTVALLSTYPLVFYLWWWFPGPVMVSAATLIWALAGSLGIFRAWQKGYFTGKVDVIIHSAVVFDILAEAVCILHPGLGAVHDGHDFWLCAAAFAAVIASYRWWRLRCHRINTRSD